MAAILDYHQRTKHSPASVRANRHSLDWDNQPLPFKIYETLTSIPLPRDFGAPRKSALAAIAGEGRGDAQLDLVRLARLLQFSAGITKKREYAGGQAMYFRAAACTGALYHIDLYVASAELPGLPAGVYHFSPHDFSLRLLRAGDHRAALIEATAAEPAVTAAQAVLISTSTFWRNAWKYQSRAYRHCYWDNGTLLANALAVASADDLAARVIIGFVDDMVNHLLGLDTQREVALSLLALGRGAPPPTPAPPQPPLTLPTRPLSAREVDYPLIRSAHAATSLPDPAAVRAWRAAPPPSSGFLPLERRQPLQPLSDPPRSPLGEVITRRGSARRFPRTPIGYGPLSSLLHAATRGVPMDWNAGDPRVSLLELYLIVHAVDGLAPGTYWLDRAGAALAPLRAGTLRREAGFLDLGQDLAADAAVNVYVLADLDRIVAAYGERGYRAAALEAGIVGGKLYLGAYALGLGATGLTFFDDEVTQFFSPHAAGKEVMFLVAIGNPPRRTR
ncbi:MAG: SagB/ThcOx family dehydrogenase [Candidatus Binatia bacterium]